jgi:hypothetical protein
MFLTNQSAQLCLPELLLFLPELLPLKVLWQELRWRLRLAEQVASVADLVCDGLCQCWNFQSASWPRNLRFDQFRFQRPHWIQSKKPQRQMRLLTRNYSSERSSCSWIALP